MYLADEQVSAECRNPKFYRCGLQFLRFIGDSLGFSAEEQPLLSKSGKKSKPNLAFLSLPRYFDDPRYFVALLPARTPEATQGIIPPPSVPAPTKKSPSTPAVKLPYLPGPI